MNRLIITGICVFALSACGKKEKEYDASGVFEATETIVSSEASGTVQDIHFEEGDKVKAGEPAVQIDSLQLLLKRKQLQAQIKAVLSRRPDISVQMAALEEQLNNAQKEQKRIESLLSAKAATQKQMDDVNNQVLVLEKQIKGMRSGLAISSNSLTEETAPLQAQIDQIDLSIDKCMVKHPVSGTILSSYIETGEMAAPGKPLYKIADMSEMILRAYITGDQFDKVKTGQKVKVMTDDGNGKFSDHEGVISWISDKAEFTPKTIQTKEERANLVYAVKVLVKNKGTLKIGMYGELKF